jgi:hypothetical protein
MPYYGTLNPKRLERLDSKVKLFTKRNMEVTTSSFRHGN